MGITFKGVPVRIVGRTDFDGNESPVRLTVQMVGSVTLNVRDAVSGTLLNDVTVACRYFGTSRFERVFEPSYSGDALQHPPGAKEDRIVAMGQASPLLVSRPLNDEGLIVHASGYSWTMVEPIKPDVQTVDVELEPAGEIALNSSELSENVFVRITEGTGDAELTSGRANGGGVIWEGLRGANDDLMILAVKSGSYDVVWGAGASGARAEVKLQCGQDVRIGHREMVIVDLVTPAPREQAEFSVFAWSDSTLSGAIELTLWRMSDLNAERIAGIPAESFVERVPMEPRSHTGHGVGWSFGPRLVDVGEYLIAFSPVGTAQVVSVTPGVCSLEVHLGECRRRKFYVLDKHREVPVRIQVGTIGVAPEGVEGTAAAGLQCLTVGGNVSEISVNAPPGTMHYTLVAENGALLTGRMAILPGVDDYVLEVDLPHILEIEITFDGRPIVVSSHWADQVVVRDEDGDPVRIVSRNVVQRGSPRPQRGDAKTRNSVEYAGSSRPPQPSSSVLLGLAPSSRVTIEPQRVAGVGTTLPASVKLSESNKTSVRLIVSAQ